MNFRQRVAWLALAVFLAVSFALAYYIFEISDSYNIFALENISNNKAILEDNNEHSNVFQRLKANILALPFWLWVIVLLVPYLQVFCVLLACTKTNPKNASLMMVPICILLKLVDCGERSPTLLTADLLET
ncbi:lysosomal enzyme trafficking factor-like [Antedon mediterranea]|uniref:lysosomal enzyme trafficking factor-like n=1 Tax=Antedon mediterranea TaxID=105859 RepID=UPI003AF5B3FF